MAASRMIRARSRWPNRAALPRWYASGCDHGARSSSAATTGIPDAIGSEPPDAW